VSATDVNFDSERKIDGSMRGFNCKWEK